MTLINTRRACNFCVSPSSQKDKRGEKLSAANSHQCQKALAGCSLDVDKQLLTVIDSSASPLPQSGASSGGAAETARFTRLNGSVGRVAGGAEWTFLTQETGGAVWCSMGQGSLSIRPSLTNPLMAFVKPCGTQQELD